MDQALELAEAEALKAALARDGYVILRGFAPPEMVQEMCRRAEDAVRDKPRKGPFSNVTKGLERIDGYFDELLHHGPQIPVLEMLAGKPPEPTTASFFTKDELAQQVHPHADAMDGVVTWIALDPTNPDNGCLQFLRGSHERREEFADLNAGTPSDLSEHPDRVEAAMSPGDMAVFRPNTVHWSGPNLDGSSRRGINCFYTGKPMNKAK